MAGDDLSVGGVSSQGHGPGKVGGLGGQPQVLVGNADAQGFAAEVLTDKVGGKFPVVGDHECHAVGGDCAAVAVLLPGESAVAIRGGDRPDPDPTLLPHPTDNVAPEALLRTLGQWQAGGRNNRHP